MVSLRFGAATGALVYGVAFGVACAANDEAAATRDVTTDEDAATDGGPPPAPPVELGRHAVAVIETRRVVPSPGLPSETKPLASNNNLDVLRHSDGRVYLAWRTAPDHFASADAIIYVASSADEVVWTFEAKLAVKSDLREPRLLSLQGSLFLYVARLGTDRFNFEPKGMSVAERSPDGTWSELKPFYEPGFIPWRARTERGTPYLVAYSGGEHIYQFDGKSLFVHLLTTTNGRDWSGVDPKAPVISEGGGSEADFTLGDDGTLYGVIRNEAGDATGWGSKVCHAKAGAITKWTCSHDPKKYDSPLMFWHDGEAYLVARRQVTETGRYDLGLRDLDHATQSFRYQLAYAGTPKRCSLWRYVQAEHRIAYVLDLPSRGDTCFASVLRDAEDGKVVIYNYSSDIAGPDEEWNRSQNRPTYIYRHVLDFARR